MGVAINHSNATAFTGGTSQSVTPLANAGDVLVIVIYQESGGNLPGSTTHHVTSVTGGGLTWARRAAVARTAGVASQLEVWWAVTAISGYTTVTITIDATTDDWAVLYFSVSGCDTTSPWDSNTALPSYADPASGTFSQPSCTGVATTSSNTMLLAFFAEEADNPGNRKAVPLGYTEIADWGTSAGTFYAGISGADMIVSSPQSAQTVSWQGAGSGGFSSPLMIVDALTAGGSAPLGSLRRISLEGNLGSNYAGGFWS